MRCHWFGCLRNKTRKAVRKRERDQKREKKNIDIFEWVTGARARCTATAGVTADHSIHNPINVQTYVTCNHGQSIPKTLENVDKKTKNRKYWKLYRVKIGMHISIGIYKMFEMF